MVINKDCCSGEPLSVEFAPYGLAPAGIGHGKVEAVLIYVVPVLGCYNVSQRIEEIVGHHLGVAA